VVERILNHTTGTFGGIAGVYKRFQYLPEMKEALTHWEMHLLQLEGTLSLAAMEGRPLGAALRDGNDRDAGGT